MPSITNLLICALMLFLITLSSSCASSRADSPPALENRTLRLSAEIPGFEYQYRVCVEKFLWFCTEKKMVKETFDLRNVEVRRKLIAMGFVARVREKH